MFEEQKLPQPDDATLAHCAKVALTIQQQILAKDGALRFDDFMRIALYEPALGYYLAGARKFGAAGDFVTAPELGPLFGTTVAEQCIQILRELDAGEILEFGGGTGALAASVLAAMDAQGVLPARYQIVELSPELRERQAETIERVVPQLRERVVWLDAPPDKPIKGCVLANEVLDALPVRKFQNRDGEIAEYWVGLDDTGAFNWQLKPADDAIESVIANEPGYENCRELDDYEFEICTAATVWVAALGDILDAGVALVFDYGSSRRERYGQSFAQGSLRCFLQHRVHDQVLMYPGGQDITCSVDFTQIAEAAVGADLRVAGYVEQVHFLTSCGILHKVGEFQQGANDDAVLELNEQLKTLLLPTKMGTHFKVMAMTKHYDQPLIGFTARDDRRLL